MENVSSLQFHQYKRSAHEYTAILKELANDMITASGLSLFKNPALRFAGEALKCHVEASTPFWNMQISFRILRFPAQPSGYVKDGIAFHTGMFKELNEHVEFLSIVPVEKPEGEWAHEPEKFTEDAACDVFANYIAENQDFIWNPFIIPCRLFALLYEEGWLILEKSVDGYKYDYLVGHPDQPDMLRIKVDLNRALEDTVILRDYFQAQNPEE